MQHLMEVPRDDLHDRLQLHSNVERFLYDEAELLDAHDYDRWLELIDPSIRYFMPLRKNTQRRNLANANSRERADIAWFDEDHFMLTQRVLQIKTGVHWAEEPPSRTTHMITNVRIVGAEASDVYVSCKFLVYRNRNEAETDVLVGRRNDVLRRDGNSFKIVRREILADQNVLTTKNLTTFL